MANRAALHEFAARAAQTAADCERRLTFAHEAQRSGLADAACMWRHIEADALRAADPDYPCEAALGSVVGFLAEHRYDYFAGEDWSDVAGLERAA